ncbi:50S ribosomal protein L11 methyltransferase [Herbaspirillum sp. alder98]|uniref:50S ribosomal protein L11 methyltransferase n=1 Tax=Herbaspirillum sp. alder98 TaxID=2913096 RepID=UPI001CD8A1D8|nr:50S ribosomal protein L11 methyltransferase [Herbaspirillum sp. alder98]MCA1324408.1 50S ribosomal protein L11 methyltransferase [Herbaspirillum sp. alder98]
MGWVEIVIEVARDQAEALSDALMDAGALSVSVEDADEGTEAERPLFGEPGMEPQQAAWDRSRVVALAGRDADHATIVADATHAIGLDYALPFATRDVEEQDWVRLTQSQFEPIHIGQRIWVVPSWHDAPDVADALILELDPGLAFGTGSHPTTRLCMEWLESNASADTGRLLDYGCGSGILALVAAKVGVPKVVGVDIDPQAMESAQYNAQRNHCEIDFFLPEPFAQLYPEGERFGIVVANILAGPLQVMAPMLAGRVATGGALVLSGVLDRQAEEVIAAYAPYIALTVWAEHEGWVALAGRLPE